MVATVAFIKAGIRVLNYVQNYSLFTIHCTIFTLGHFILVFKLCKCLHYIVPSKE